MEEDWELLELTGPCTAYAVHFPSDTVVYAIGSIIVVWDVHTDKKINIRCHEGPVTSLVFSSDWQFLISLESCLQPMVSVWRWQTLEQITVKWLPFKPRRRAPAVKATFSSNVLCVLENEFEGGYRISLWTWNTCDLALVQVEDLEIRKRCLGLSIFSQTILTCESSCIKLWKMQDPFTIAKRLHFQSSVKQGIYTSGHLIVLLDSGDISILNLSGGLVCSITQSAYTAIASNTDFLFAGCEDGSVDLYLLKDFKWAKTLGSSHCCRIADIKVARSAHLMFEDSTIQIVQVKTGHLLNQSSGHAAAVHSLGWTHGMNFVSASDEHCLYSWTYAHHGWEMQALDVSGKKSNVTALAVHPSFQMVGCGFSKGTVKLFQVEEYTRLIQTCQHSSSEVIGLDFSSDLLLITYKTGQVLLIDAWLNRPIIWLEDPTSIKYPTSGVFAGASRALTLRESSLVQLHNFERRGSETEKMYSLVFPLESDCRGLSVHKSESYFMVSIESNALCFFKIADGEPAGVIRLDSSPRGCFQDPAGLYVCCMLPTAEKKYSKVVIYEIGTGKKACELTRLDSIGSCNACAWSGNGQLLLVGGSSGSLSIWKVPKALAENVGDVVEILDQNPNFWERFPIDLPEKSLGKAKNTRVGSPVFSVKESSTNRKFGAFADSVVYFVKNDKMPQTRNGRMSDRMKSTLGNSFRKENRRDPRGLYNRGRTTQRNDRFIKSSSQAPVNDIDVLCEGVNDAPISSPSEMDRSLNHSRFKFAYPYAR